MVKKIILFILVLVLLQACGNENVEKQTLNNNVDKNQVVIKSDNFKGRKQDNMRIDDDVTNSKYVSNSNLDEKSKNRDMQIKNENFLRQQKLVEEIKKEIEEKEEKEEEAIERLDLSFCNKYKSKDSKDECKLRMVFSKYNKKGCRFIKNNTELYKKCLEIKKGIEEYKKIRKIKYYYEHYGTIYY